MKSKLYIKCFITLGLLLFLTVLMPFVNTSTVHASDTAKEKSEAYRLNLTSIIIAKGQTRVLKTYNVGDTAKISFKSDNQDIASVSDSSGVITANKVGETTVYAIIKDGNNSTSLPCSVIVGPPAISVKWTQSRIIIGLNDTNALKVILKPSNTAEDAVFDSANSSIVTISPGGRITAKSYGLTTVKAFIDLTEADGSRKCDTCTVIVTSQDNVSKLNEYFSNRPELDKLPQNELNSALSKFFNEEFDQTKSSTVVSSLDKYLNQTFDFSKLK